MGCRPWYQRNVHPWAASILFEASPASDEWRTKCANMLPTHAEQPWFGAIRVTSGVLRRNRRLGVAEARVSTDGINVAQWVIPAHSVIRGPPSSCAVQLLAIDSIQVSQSRPWARVVVAAVVL